MLRRERALRLSPRWQRRFARAELRADRDWADEAALLQREVVRAFGFRGGLEDGARSVAHGLLLLRSACQLHPGDAEMRDAAIHVKHNLAADGRLRVGDDAPDPPLVPIGGGGGGAGADGAAPRPLSSFLTGSPAAGEAAAKALVVVSGSYS